MKSSPARIHTLNALNFFEWNMKRARYERIKMDAFLRERSALLEKREADFMTELTFKIMRNLILVDRIIQHLSTKDVTRLPFYVRNVLRMGICEILFMDSVPAYASVNEAVGLIKSSCHPHFAPYVNGLLRKVSLEGKEVVDRLKSQETEVKSREVKALAGAGSLRFSRDDGSHTPALTNSRTELFEITYSHPAKVISMYEEAVGKRQVEEILKSHQEENRVGIRINPLKRIDRGVLESEIQLEPVEFRGSRFYIQSRDADAKARVLARERFEKGEISYQSVSSQFVLRKIAPRSGETVIELCSGRGIKTTGLGEIMGNKGKMISVDSDEGRLKEQERNLKRCSVTIAEIVRLDILQGRLPNTRGDRVLLDAPCSGSGIVRKAPEKRYYLSEKIVREFREIQKKMILAAADFVKPAGYLFYSTCSVFPEENEEVVNHLLIRKAEFKALGSWGAVPSEDYIDGFFLAKLRRR